MEAMEARMGVRRRRRRRGNAGGLGGGAPADRSRRNPNPTGIYWKPDSKHKRDQGKSHAIPTPGRRHCKRHCWPNHIHTPRKCVSNGK